MSDFKKEYKKLYKNYYKSLSKIHRKSLAHYSLPLEYFVTYLKFLRDKLLLETSYKKELGEENLELVSLITALQAFENYNTCIYKFYDVQADQVVHKAEYTAETAQTAFQEERLYHWETFWNLVKLCIEGWGVDAKS